MGSTLQKWLLGLIALGAGVLVAANPDAFYKAASGLGNLTAGSVQRIVYNKPASTTTG